MFCDGTDGQSKPLMLLFLLPQSLEMIDPSHILEKYSVPIEVDKWGGVDFLNRQFQMHKPIKCDKI